MTQHRPDKVNSIAAEYTADKLFSHCHPEPNSGCWLWGRAYKYNGYGLLYVGKIWCLAHRLSWALHNRPLAGGECVLHRCDNRACVNPEHLFVGDHRANAEDRERKGRGRRLKGAEGTAAKLTPKQVLEIRASADGAMALGRAYGVSHTAIRHIKTRRNWAHLTGRD